MTPAPDPIVAKVEALQNVLVATATNGRGAEHGDYGQLRMELLANPLTKGGLPRFVHTCRDLSQFWQFIKYKFSTYAERREYLWAEFRPLLEALEARPNTPFQPSDEQLLTKLGPESVQAVWNRALERRISVLLTRRGPGEKLSGLWEFPGGKVEPEETLEQCLTRELLEELGLEVFVGGVVAESVYTYDHDSIQLVAMEATILKGQLTLTVHDQAEWVLPHALDQFSLAPADVAIARAVQELFAERRKKRCSPTAR